MFILRYFGFEVHRVPVGRSLQKIVRIMVLELERENH